VQQTAQTLDIRVGSPAGHRGIVVAPLFRGGDPVARYVPLAQGRAMGLNVAPLPAVRGVVRQVVTNPADTDVLIHQDELLAGSAERCVLVGAGALVLLSRPERHTRSLADPWSGAGWADDIGFGRRCAASRAAPGGGPAWALPAHEDQVGAVLLVAGRPVRLDLVSRPEAFAHRLPALLAEYALWAARAGVQRVEPPAWVAEDFVADALGAPAELREGIGCALHLRVHDRGLLGHGLVVDGELIQLSVLAREGRAPGRR
jgi:hypothetical protein